MDRFVLATQAAGPVGRGTTPSTSYAPSEEASGQRGVGAGETVLLHEMLDCLAKELGLSPKVRQLPPHEADVYSTRADLAHSKVVLGYQPKTGFPEGLSHFLKWFRAVNP